MSIRSYLAWPGAPLAIASAALFGASTPLAKALLGGGVSPWLLAGLLYLGSGLGLAAAFVVRSLRRVRTSEAPLVGRDIGWMTLVVLSGGVAGPLLLMVGLSTTPASSAALLLNLEGLATMAIAWLVFRENVDRRLLIGASAILAGAVLLSWTPGQGFAGLGVGALAVAGACLAWGIDNNLTRMVSGSDPLQIAMIKGLAAGAVNLTLAFALGAHMPPLSITLAAGVVGFLGYGVSLVLFVFALRFMGTARTGAYFSTAPFIGAALAIVLFGEALTLQLVGAAALMLAGLYLHLVEQHNHVHAHSPMAHEHAHVHDEHHQHAHRTDDPGGEPHTHPHAHEAMVHKHPHYPDLHHRHGHAH
jgi:drug/metabolite transporter (DMT)-like permease